jgi:tetratricopeptide (TPR) repeat protein
MQHPDVDRKRPDPRPLPTYEHVRGLHVLRLRGDDYEMGHQHGAALREAIARGPLPYFDAYVQRMLAAGLGPRVGAAAGVALQRTVGRKIAAGFPARARRAMKGLADGAGLSERDVLRAVTMPETYLWVLRQILRVRRPALAPRHGVPLMGCTSALAWGSATADRALLHGRNFDYQGVGAWDAEQAVVFHTPSDGQRYVSVAAAGVLFGGITAMNASGLSLAVHQHLGCESFALGGTPVGVVGDDIMRNARSLDDARRILDGHRPNGCWTYVLGSAREEAALCYEITPAGRASIFERGGTFGYANVFFDEALGRTERHLYPAQWRNNLGRLRRVRELLAEGRGTIGPRDIAAMLGDVGTGCPFEGGIAMLMTVASVVFRPWDGRLWVATGRAPTSLRSFVAFDCATETASAGGQDDDISAGAPAALADALDDYRAAYEAYFNEDDVPAARVRLESAIRRAPEVGVLHYVNGLLALRDGDPRAAKESFDRALALGHHSAARLASVQLWRARALDGAGRREEALASYRAALGGDEPVRAAAERGLRRPWKARRFGIEMACADVPVP